MRGLRWSGMLIPLLASAGEVHFTQQGRVLDSSGDPLLGSHTVTVALSDAPSGGTALWTRTFSEIPFEAGYYAVPVTGLDDGGLVDLDAVAATGAWLSVTIDGTPLLSGQRLGAVPRAAIATTAEHVDWSDVAAPPAHAAAAPSTCPSGQGLRWTGTAWACVSPAWTDITSRPAHTTATPPTCNGARQALQWSGSAWSCVTLGGTAPTCVVRSQSGTNPSLACNPGEVQTAFACFGTSSSYQGGGQYPYQCLGSSQQIVLTCCTF